MLGNRVDRIYDVGVAGIHRLFDKLDRIRAVSYTHLMTLTSYCSEQLRSVETSLQE